MDRKCFSMKDPLSIGLCLGAKTVSPYDHVGVVYRADERVIASHPNVLAAVKQAGGPSPTGTYVLEANAGGVTLRSLEARLKRTSGNEIAVRPLHIPAQNRPAIQSAMDAVVNDVMPYKYKTNLVDFAAMSLKPPDKVDRMMAAVKMRFLYNEIALIREQLRVLDASKSRTSAEESDRRLLHKMHGDFCDARRWLASTYFSHLPQTNVDSELVIVDFDSKNLLFVDGENCGGPAKGVFCSELVVHLWQRTGILKRFPPATSFAPVDFDKWDDEFNFSDERYHMAQHQVLSPEHSRVTSIERGSVDVDSTGTDTASRAVFMQQRESALHSIHKACHLKPPKWTREELIDLPSVVPSRWLIQSTSHYHLSRDMSERVVVVGTLFSLVGVAFSRMQLTSLERQIGMRTVRGSQWSLGLMLHARSMAATLLQAWWTFIALRQHSKTQPDAKSHMKVMRHSGAVRSSLVDDRHPFYTTAALLVGCGAAAGVVTHGLARGALLWHFGPSRPTSQPLRFLWRGSLQSALFFTFSYGGGWLVWYECFGPLYFTTETSVMRRRREYLPRDERWTVQQRDAVLSAMMVTLGVEAVLYPMQTRIRRRFVKEMYHPEPAPLKHQRLFAGFLVHISRSAAVCAITGAAVWNWLL